MTAATLLDGLRDRGFQIETTGQKLLVTPASRLTSDDRAAIQLLLADLLGLLTVQAQPPGLPHESPVTPDFSCADCRHLSKVKTCTNPVAAGLLTEAQGFGIVWPPAGYGAACQAWRRNPAEAVLDVYTAAGRGGWPDALMHQWLRDADEHPDAVLDVLHNGGPTPARPARLGASERGRAGPARGHHTPGSTREAEEDPRPDRQPLRRCRRLGTRLKGIRTMTTNDTHAEALNHLLHAAAAAITEGLDFARRDDPHRYSTLSRDFDDGQALPRLTVDFLPAGQVRVGLVLHGARDGQPHDVGVFCTTLQGPPEAGRLN